MKCPHCLIEFHSGPKYVPFAAANPPVDEEGAWGVEWEICPACKRVIIRLVVWPPGVNQKPRVHSLVRPRGIAQAPLSPDVPKEFAQDYREACLILADSPKASAALSRRCLQHVLRDAAKTKKKDLIDQINEVMPNLPSYLAKMIESVRVMGNFAVHPIKSTNTGEIVDVEPEEAEWLLDTLEGVFDFYFVQPAEAERKRQAINEKLADAGKPLLR